MGRSEASGATNEPQEVRLKLEPSQSRLMRLNNAHHGKRVQAPNGVMTVKALRPGGGSSLFPADVP